MLKGLMACRISASFGPLSSFAGLATRNLVACCVPVSQDFMKATCKKIVRVERDGSDNYVLHWMHSKRLESWFLGASVMQE